MHPFLDHLGLDIRADARGIKRAYARLLKQIDPEQDPAAFQELREAYEAALWWVQHHAQDEGDADDEPTEERVRAESANGSTPPQGASSSPEGRDLPVDSAGGTNTRGSENSPSGQPSVQESPETASASEPERPHAEAPDVAAHAVFDDFASAIKVAPMGSVPAALHALQESLADPRLVHLDARTVFEWRVANLLASGWAPGHEHLFEAAIETFHWDNDSRRLQMFGHLGHFIDAAIVQHLARNGDNPGYHRRQNELLHLLRREQHPGVPTLTTELGVVQHMAQHYPQWMAIQVPGDALLQWQRWASGITHKPERPVAAPPAASNGSHQWVFWMICFGLFAVTKLLSSMSFDSAHMPPDAARPAAAVLDRASEQSMPIPLDKPAAPPVTPLLPGSGSPFDRAGPGPVFTPERLTAMMQGKLTTAACADLAEWTSRMHAFKQVPPPAADKRVIDCAAAKLWPHTSPYAPVTEALNRENARLEKSLQRMRNAHKEGMPQKVAPPPRDAFISLPPSGMQGLDDLSTLGAPTGLRIPGKNPLQSAPERPLSTNEGSAAPGQ